MSGAGPLADIRVLDVSRLLPGGFCTLLMADLGADVVKVEDTGPGDYVRWTPPFYGTDEQTGLGTRSALYLALNRNKRSVRLDLKRDAGREAFLRLAEQADVAVEGFRPGVMERLGVGYEQLRERNPRIVYTALTGYGRTGPHTSRAGHDINYLALGGGLGLSGTRDGPPTSASVQIADLGGGAMMAAFATLAALNHARHTGEGQLVDVSMTDGAQSFLTLVAARYFCEGRAPARGDLDLAGGFTCYHVYECADGYVSCGALEPKFWAVFCGAVGREDLIEHQYSPAGTEARHEVAEIFRGRTREQWRAFNDEHDCCVEPILELDEALGSELAREREVVVELDQPELGSIRQLGFPVKLSGTPGRVRGPAPAFGEHTEEVLRDAGYSSEQVRELVEAGAAAGLAERERPADARIGP
jgi:alpha-methylacyl-CoA racemase